MLHLIRVLLQEEAYHMLLAIFAESLLPYLEGLDSWLYEGILDDPYEEVCVIIFFAISIYPLGRIYFHDCIS